MKTWKSLSIILVILLSVSVISCANRAQTGAALGGAAGALIGSTQGSWLIGGGIGSALGYIIGNEWDKYDERQAQAAFQANRRTSWKSKHGIQYTAIPQGSYYRNGRQYKTMKVVDSRGNTSLVTLAKRRDGKWEVVN